ncbi:hypothetical protein Tco_0573153 [Tanacetum coccineum]
MDDLWSIGNHDFVVEMNAHRKGLKRNSNPCYDESVFSTGGTTFCLGGTGSELTYFNAFSPKGNEAERHYQQTSLVFVVRAQNENRSLELKHQFEQLNKINGSVFSTTGRSVPSTDTINLTGRCLNHREKALRTFGDSYPIVEKESSVS